MVLLFISKIHSIIVLYYYLLITNSDSNVKVKNIAISINMCSKVNA